MAPNLPTATEGSFRMPNSIVQGLTTSTPADLNRLTPFQMVTLFGLVAHLSPKNPQKEVRLKVSDILEIIKVGKTVDQAVDRSWTNRDGAERRGQYKCRRYSPRHLKLVHDALLALHDQSVAIRSYDPRSDRRVEDRIVHVLDSFGYSYEVGGRAVDVDELPAGREKVNMGTEEWPVWRIRRAASDGGRYDRPAGILFRLNTELAHELQGRRGTISFTLFAIRVFDLFREFMATPAAIRLLVLVLRQTGGGFTRTLSQLLDDLGWDVSHPSRAIEQLTASLERLASFRVVTDFVVDREADRLVITLNRDWYVLAEPVF